jgi:hypothetical protein
MENDFLFHGFSTAVSRRIDQWLMRAIQLITIFDQNDMNQHDPADVKKIEICGKHI